jgi:hypothetical protein
MSSVISPGRNAQRDLTAEHVRTSATVGIVKPILAMTEPRARLMLFWSRLQGGLYRGGPRAWHDERGGDDTKAFGSPAALIAMSLDRDASGQRTTAVSETTSRTRLKSVTRIPERCQCIPRIRVAWGVREIVTMLDGCPSTNTHQDQRHEADAL